MTPVFPTVGTPQSISQKDGSPETEEGAPEYYYPGMVLSPDIRKFPPTVTRGWLFHDAGEKAVEVMKPLHRDLLSRMTSGRFKGKKMRELVAQRKEFTEGERELMSRVNRHFMVTPIGFSLRSRKDLNEKQMDAILRVATEIMLHPMLNKGEARGCLQFRMASGHFFIAEWNSQEKRFYIQTGAVMPIMYEGSAPWLASVR